MGTSQADAVAELERLDEQYQELLRSLASADWERRSTIGDGDWSLRDLVGHVMSWEELALAAIADAISGRKPPPPSGDIDQINQDMVERQRQLSLEALRSGATATHARLIQTISELPPETWTRPMALGDDPPEELGEVVGGVLGAEDHPFGHLLAHLDDLRALNLASGLD
ncbi:MAG TPA: maleylpyruvate isomerase N-terminal domain-containing protein [Candidatus Dormibacteraeota bacterium]